MVKAPKISSAAAVLALDAIRPLVSSGILRIYEGAAPTSADSAITSQKQLVQHQLMANAFTAAAAQGDTAVCIASGTVASGTILSGGTPAFFRISNTADNATVFQGTVGLSDADIILNTLNFVQFEGVRINVVRIRLPEYTGAPTS